MKTYKVIGLLALIFLAGFAGGVVATRIVVRRMVAYAVAHPAGAGQKVEVTLDHKLHLDESQRQQVHEILKDSRDRLRVVREDFQPQFNAVALETRSNIAVLLKPEQQKRFEQFLADNHQFLPVRETPTPKKLEQTAPADRHQ
jgi:hypothetical protein